MPVYFEVWIPGEAKSERKRQRVFRNKAGQVVLGKRTDEPDRVDWKTWVKTKVDDARGEPFVGPIRLTAYVMGPKPKSRPKNPTEKYPWPWARIVRPDAGNYTKLLEDAVNGIGYADDGQIVDSRSVKVYGPETGVLLVIEQVTQDDDDATVGYIMARVCELRETAMQDSESIWMAKALHAEGGEG